MKSEIRNCEEALRVLAAHLDGELDPARRQELERHLETCRSCYSRAEFERRLKERVAAVGQEPVSTELTSRIRTMIGDFDVPGAAEAGTATTP